MKFHEFMNTENYTPFPEPIVSISHSCAKMDCEFESKVPFEFFVQFRVVLACEARATSTPKAQGNQRSFAYHIIRLIIL